MLIRLPLVEGIGPDGRPEKRVPLPAYNMRANGDDWALVDVPETDIPDVPELRAALQTMPGGNLKRRRVAKPLLEAWWDHLDRRYLEHAGRFRPVLAV